ncbi:MAG: hypothetical protein ACK5LX_07590 [Oscillospiraceae bacterium]
MPDKKLMFHFFHERNYSPQSLEAFEREAELAAAAGATHMFIMDVPKRLAEWAAHPGDPYPNWGMLQTSLFKLAVPKALEGYLDSEYARKNLALVRERSKIVQRQGMQAAVLVIDPFYLPEQAYLDHPSWRGPRCDHPRRSKDIYFSPCIDNTEVRALYYEAMQRLCEEVDIGFLQIITNDSGAGVCWSSGLYNGPNGPQACKQTSMAQRIVGFLQVLHDAAHSKGRDTVVDITSDIYGYKAPETSMDAAWTSLLDGQLVTGRDKHGKKPVQHMLSDLAEHVRTMKGLPLTVDFIRHLHNADNSDSAYIKVMLHCSEFDEYLRILKLYRELRPQDTEQLYTVLKLAATQIAGEKQASALLDAWCLLDEAVGRMANLCFDNFVLMPMISQRLINRPLVPFPALLTAEETAYYRPFLFQATTDEQALDIMNIQGMDFIKGFAATRILKLTAEKAVPLLQRAAALFESIGAQDAETGAKFALTARRARVLACLVQTLRNAALYQEVLDSTLPEEEPEYSPVWPIEGDERLTKLNELARAEIDNTCELIGLLANDTASFFAVAEGDADEDIFLLSDQLPRQLARKVEIMLAHMRDAERIYESKNK